MKATGPRRGQGYFPGILLLVYGTLIAGVLSPAAETRRPASPADLDDLLERAAAYCDRLSQTVMDFVCCERVEEWLYPRANLVRSFARPRALSTGRRETHRFVYDYQLVRDRAGAILETRTLLKKNRQDLNIPGARLETRLFWHSGIVMGPLGLLSGDKQKAHDYRILREDRIGDDRALVVEAVPKPGARSDHLIGAVWLRLGDGGVLKIEWDPASIENYAAVEQTAARFKMEPRIVMTSEFAFEKNGIRFPSRFTIKEIYKKSLLRFERSEIDVLYDQYKFFTVETQVKFEK